MTHIIAKHYIDRDSVAKALSTVFSDKEHGDPNFINGIITAVDFILDYPTEKVEEVRHGEWIPLIQNYHCTDPGVVDNLIIGYRCSVCGEIEKFKYKYCHCGAKMDKEEEV